MGREFDPIPDRLNEITGHIITAAIEVHRELGPGLPESIYQEALARELASGGRRVEREVKVEAFYKGRSLDRYLRVDLLIDGEVVVELKAIEALGPAQRAQLLSQLKLLDARVGLLINFNRSRLVKGVQRVVNPGTSTTLGPDP